MIHTHYNRAKSAPSDLAARLRTDQSIVCMLCGLLMDVALVLLLVHHSAYMRTHQHDDGLPPTNHHALRSAGYHVGGWDTQGKAMALNAHLGVRALCSHCMLQPYAISAVAVCRLYVRVVT